MVYLTFKYHVQQSPQLFLEWSFWYSQLFTYCRKLSS